MFFHDGSKLVLKILSACVRRLVERLDFLRRTVGDDPHPRDAFQLFSSCNSSKKD